MSIYEGIYLMDEYFYPMKKKAYRKLAKVSKYEDELDDWEAISNE